jgi:sirohydrochlorin cobaltochelatase
MEGPPLIADWDKLSNQPNVVIVPFFIADGLHSYQDIPVLIGIEAEPGPAASEAEVFRRNPYELRGKKLFYASAIGTEPMIAEVILDQVEALVRRQPAVNQIGSNSPARSSTNSQLVNLIGR